MVILICVCVHGHVWIYMAQWFQKKRLTMEASESRILKALGFICQSSSSKQRSLKHQKTQYRLALSPCFSVLWGYIHYLRVWKATPVEHYMAESQDTKTERRTQRYFCKAERCCRCLEEAWKRWSLSVRERWCRFFRFTGIFVCFSDFSHFL